MKLSELLKSSSSCNEGMIKNQVQEGNLEVLRVI